MDRPEALPTPATAHGALLLMDAAEGAIRHACVTQADKERYYTEALAFWAVVAYLRKVRAWEQTVPTLRWEKVPGFTAVYAAYAGEMEVGTVGQRENGTVWYTAHSAVHMRWISKAAGEVKTLAYARRAVVKAWRRWLSYAQLTPTMPTLKD